MKLLLMAGASETGSIAQALAMEGFHVIVSTVSYFPMDVRLSDRITRRVGALTAVELSALCLEMDVAAIIDATHPYAAHAHANVRDAAQRLNLPAFRYDRPSAATDGPGIHSVRSHDQAASLAVSFGLTILLTSGTRNLEPYAGMARSAGVELFVRALDCQESRNAVINHGIPLDHCEFGVGPFSVQDNMRLIRKVGAGVVVTKDGGIAGGLPEKLEASRLMNCQVVLVSRPEADSSNAFDSIPALVDAVRSTLL